MNIDLTLEQISTIRWALHFHKRDMENCVPVTKVHSENIKYQLDIINETLVELQEEKDHP